MKIIFDISITTHNVTTNDALTQNTHKKKLKFKTVSSEFSLFVSMSKHFPFWFLRTNRKKIARMSRECFNRHNAFMSGSEIQTLMYARVDIMFFLPNFLLFRFCLDTSPKWSDTRYALKPYFFGKRKEHVETVSVIPFPCRTTYFIHFFGCEIRDSVRNVMLLSNRLRFGGVLVCCF